MQEKIAHYLQDNPKVEKVYWPGFIFTPKSFSCKKTNVRFWRNVIISDKGIRKKKKKETILFLEKLKLFTLCRIFGRS